MAKKSAIQAPQAASNDGFVPDDESGFVEDAPEQSTGDWLLQNVAKPIAATPLDMATGVARGGVDLANLIPGVHLQQPLDLAQAAGVGGNRGDELIKNLSSYIPTAAASEFAAPMEAVGGISPLLGKLATEGGVYQASQTPDSPGKIALAAAVNAGIPGSAHGLDSALTKGAEFFGAPGVAQNILSPMMDLKDLSNEQAFNDVSANLDKHEKVEGKAWDDVIYGAKYHDNNILNRGKNKSAYPSEDYQDLEIIPQKAQIENQNSALYAFPSNKNSALYAFPSKSMEPANGSTSLMSGSKNEISDYTGPQSLDAFPSNIPPDYTEGEFKDIPADAEKSKPILDTSKYVNPILDKIKEYQSLADDHSGFNNNYSGPIDTLKKYLNKSDVEGLVSDDELGTYGKDKYSTFKDALTQNKALNIDYKNTVKPNSGVLKTQSELDATNFARDKLHDMIQDNLDKYGLSDTLGKEWMNARNLTRDQANIFKTVPDAKGNPKISDFYAHTLSNNPYSDPTGFIKQYIPGKGEGTGSMEQFSAMVGNKDKATDYLKSNIFADSMKGDEPNVSKFIDKTQGLSPDQIQYLFNPRQQEQLKLLSNLNKKYPTEMPDAWKSIATGAVAAMVGGMAHPALAIGGVAGPAAYNLAFRGLALPGISNKIQSSMIQRMNSQGPMYGQTPANISRSLIAANQSGGNQ